jgi:integrase
MTSKLNDAQKHAFRVLRYIRIIQEEFLFPDKPVYAEGPIQFDPIAWGNKRRLLPKPRKSRKLTVDYLELEKHCREGSGNFRSSHYEPHPRRHDDWPRTRLRDPDPFTEDERDKILAYFKQKIPHYYPFVLTQFLTGMRPSEALALRWSDIDLEQREIYISKSRYIDDGAATKTAGSIRVIKLVQHVGEQLQQLFNSTPRRLDDDGQEHVFLNEDGKPIDFHTWRGKVSGRETQAGEKTPHGVWYRALRGAGVRPRGPYHTRHVHLSRA